MMNFRLAQPSMLVNLNNVPELSYIQPARDGGVRVGAMTRQREVEQNSLITETAPMIHEAMPRIAYAQIRNRGTFGGSIAHADPSAELPAASVALGGRFLLRSQRGERWLAASDFFVGLFPTALEPDVLLTEVAVPPMPLRSGWSFQKVARRHHDFALVGVAAVVTLDGGGQCEHVRLVYFQVRVADVPRQSISLGELAARANPLRGAVEPGTEPGLEATDYFGPRYCATAAGSHALILEVDPETMMVEVKRYILVEDCGTMLNPLIVEGQLQGGVALGLANSYYEKLVYDENGQLLNASLADYLMPTAMEVPRVEIAHENTPSPFNPLGSKGVGEGGTIPVPALFAQALENAPYDRDLEVLEMPLSPNGLFELLKKA